MLKRLPAARRFVTLRASENDVMRKLLTLEFVSRMNTNGPEAVVDRNQMINHTIFCVSRPVVPCLSLTSHVSRPASNRVMATP